ncbi:hypothetical protein NEUTE2DRAFT_121431, partial [Neurospora tetrasperma FGSC 2509]
MDTALMTQASSAPGFDCCSPSAGSNLVVSNCLEFSCTGLLLWVETSGIIMS